MALGAYLTVRMQLQATLDDSLLDRAHKTAQSTEVSGSPTQHRLPASMLGAADVRIAFVTDATGSYTRDQRADAAARRPRGRGRQRRKERASAPSRRAAPATAWSRCHHDDGHGAESSPSRSTPRRPCSRSSAA